LGGRLASLDHILRDAGLSDLKAELEQLAMDAQHRYSWMKNKRSPFVSRMRPRTFRRNMIS
jgi:hypothetical protein